MNARGENALVMSLAGLLLAGGLLVLFALGWAFRGYDPARMVLAMIPVGLGLAFAGAGAYLGLSQRRPAAVGEGAPAAPATAGMSAMITVMESQGICPLGYAMAVGDRWAIRDGLESAAGLCPRARKAVGVYLAELASGGTPAELPSCITKRHRAIFQVDRQQQELVAAR